MKKKNFSKVLVLNKKTIADLAKNELNAAKGGATLNNGPGCDTGMCNPADSAFTWCSCPAWGCTTAC
jgi:hypothetical protein